MMIDPVNKHEYNLGNFLKDPGHFIKACEKVDIEIALKYNRKHEILDRIRSISEKHGLTQSRRQ